MSCMNIIHTHKIKSNMDLKTVNWIAVRCGFCVLFVVHSIYSILNYFFIYILYILHHFKRLYNRTHTSHYASVNILKEELRCCPKIPKHLAVIIEEEEISYHDCIKLILWCIHSGIPFISFYSHSSAINPTSLYEVLCKRSKSSLQNIKWGKSFHESVKEMAKKDINGYVWMPSIEVNMFSSKSTFDSIENVILRLCHKGVNPDQITEDFIDQKFKEEIPLPDPCLALVFGETLSTFGFMPWQIRVTEFSHFSTHHNLQLETFISSIKSYAYCQQRFGK